ncbi:Alkylmercury lyase [Trichinella spiralis]|uniref:Alkylmercury lyase n=1 Tax=Trichinella spiralis TaxID=6334 RepID=A0ABR3K0K3_TRISP
MYLSVDREDNVVGIGLVIFATVHNYRLDGSEHTVKVIRLRFCFACSKSPRRKLEYLTSRRTTCSMCSGWCLKN